MSKKSTGKGRRRDQLPRKAADSKPSEKNDIERRGKPQEKADEAKPQKTNPAAIAVLLASAASLITGYGYWRGLLAAVVLILTLFVAPAIATLIVKVAG